MAQVPNVDQEAPATSKLPTILRTAGVGVLVLVLWLIDKAATGRLPKDSVWRYVIGGVIVFVGMMTVLSISDRLNSKTS
jgi:hypothetical protein